MRRLVDIGDTRLWVVSRGAGPDVFILHGGPGADHTQLLDPLTPLADEFRLVFIDQRSQGRSERTPKETWTVHHAAKDVVALADALGVRSYGLLGHSYGALVALQHAVSYPKAATATVVSHGVPATRWYRLMEELDGLEPPEVRVKVAKAWSELESATDPGKIKELIAQQAPFHFKNPLGPEVQEEANRYRSQMIHTPEVNRYMSRTGFGGFDVEEQLATIDHPVLLLSGRYERTCPMEAATFMAEQIPGAQLHIFDNSAHVSYVEERATYLSVVRSFLQDHLY